MTNNCFLFCFGVVFRDDSDEASDSHLQVVKRKIVKNKKKQRSCKTPSCQPFICSLRPPTLVAEGLTH